jgi:hypothetical protein
MNQSPAGAKNGVGHEISHVAFVMVGFVKPAQGQIGMPETPS